MKESCKSSTTYCSNVFSFHLTLGRVSRGLCLSVTDLTCTGDVHHSIAHFADILITDIGKIHITKYHSGFFMVPIVLQQWLTTNYIVMQKNATLHYKHNLCTSVNNYINVSAE